MTDLLDNAPAISVADVLPIVDAVVAQMSLHLPSHVSAQDLASAGKLALMEVLQDFEGSIDRNRGYVVCRVRGAVLDEMRRLDPLSRYGRTQVRRLRQSVASLELELGRSPTDSEIASATGYSQTAVRKLDQLAVAAEALSIDAFDDDGRALGAIPDPDAVSPASVAEDSDGAAAVRAALQRLPSIQARVLQRYYFDGATLQDIATDLGVSIVRVHQLRSSAEARLRSDTNILDAWNSLFPRTPVLAS